MTAPFVRAPWLAAAGVAAVALASAVAPQAARAAAMGCLITPSKLIELGSPSIGIIERVHVEKGDAVKSRQVLVTLRDDIERASLSLAVARANAEAELEAANKAYDFAKRKHERNEDLLRQNFVSTQAVDQSLADLQAAQARQAQAQEQSKFAKREASVASAQLDNRTIRSPIDGVVVDVYRHEGERVEEKPMLKIAAIDPLYAEVVLPAGVHGLIKSGDELDVKPLLPGQVPLKGVVRIVDQLIDPSSNTFRVRLVLANREHRVPAGVRCELQLPDSVSRAMAQSTLPPQGKIRAVAGTD
jgi:RND family efflux transporter MFP subunit